MKESLRTYSRILQLHGDTYRTIRESPAALAYALKLFVIVALIAGLGRWFALPIVIQQPLLSERIDSVATAIQRLEARFSRTVQDTLDEISAENVEARIRAALPAEGPISAAALEQALAQADLSVQELAAAAARLEAATEVVQPLLDQGELSAEALAKRWAEQGVTGDQVSALLASAAADGRADLAGAAAQLGSAEWFQTLAGSNEQAAQLLAQLVGEVALTPDRLEQVMAFLQATPENVRLLAERIKAIPDESVGLLMEAKATAEELSPPIGTRPSRVLHLFGNWLTIPFEWMSGWIFFALATLIGAKLLGGRGTASQHLAGVALASAPAVLLLVTYIPDMTPIWGVVVALAILYFGRVLALIGLVWAALILVKSLSIAHEISMWRALGVLLFTWLLVYVATPLASIWALGYLLGG